MCSPLTLSPTILVIQDDGTHSSTSYGQTDSGFYKWIVYVACIFAWQVWKTGDTELNQMWFRLQAVYGLMQQRLCGAVVTQGPTSGNSE